MKYSHIYTVRYKQHSLSKKILKNIDWIIWVIHFAGFKAVWESAENPFLYHRNNVCKSVDFYEMLNELWIKNIIFSSSATVYDLEYTPSPIPENAENITINPYWTTKYINELILKDLSMFKWFNAINLRYFNPIWAHKSWLIWENPKAPNNLLPYLFKVLNWELEILSVFWDDYDTEDWSGVRDYIHVMDLAEAHLYALECLIELDFGWYIDYFNVWTGRWTSVFEMIELVEIVTWKKVNYKVVERRDWDVWLYYADCSKIKETLGWESKYSVEDAIIDGWRFIKMSSKQSN